MIYIIITDLYKLKWLVISGLLRLSRKFGGLIYTSGSVSLKNLQVYRKIRFQALQSKSLLIPFKIRQKLTARVKQESLLFEKNKGRKILCYIYRNKNKSNFKIINKVANRKHKFIIQTYWIVDDNLALAKLDEKNYLLFLKIEAML